MSTAFGWTCTRCTYQHSAPGTRCVMCNELRVTKEQMRDFVMGKTLSKEHDDKVNEAPPPSVKENRPPPPLAASVPPKPAPAPQIRNPYARKVSSTDNTAVTAPVKPAPSNANQPSPFFSQSSRPNTGSTTNRQAQQQQPATWNPPRNIPASRNDSVGNSSMSAAFTEQRGPTYEQQQSWCPPSELLAPTRRISKHEVSQIPMSMEARAILQKLHQSLLLLLQRIHLLWQCDLLRCRMFPVPFRYAQRLLPTGSTLYTNPILYVTISWRFHRLQCYTIR